MGNISVDFKDIFELLQVNEQQDFVEDSLDDLQDPVIRDHVLWRFSANEILSWLDRRDIENFLENN